MRSQWQRIELALAVCSWMFLTHIPRNQAQSFRWVASAGGSDVDAPLALALDPSGNVYVTGHFAGESELAGHAPSAGGLDGFLCQFDPAGNLISSSRFGGPQDDAGTSLVVDSTGNLHLTGYFSGKGTFGTGTLSSRGSTDIFVAEFDRKGQPVWSVRAGGLDRDVASGIATDGFGGSYVTGSYVGLADFGSTNLPGEPFPQFFLAKYDARGGLLWARNTGGGERAVGNGVVSNNAGEATAVGHYFPLAPANLKSIGFLARYGPSGEQFWYRTFPGDSPNSAQAVALDARGDCCVAGYFSGSAKFGEFTLRSSGDRDIFVVKCDPAGRVLWARGAGGASTDVASCIAVDSEGSCFIGGYYIGIAHFGTTKLSSVGSADAFVAKLDPNGQVLWALAAGGSVNMEVSGLGLDATGGAYLTGQFRYNTRFGGFTLTNRSTGLDIFLARLESPPSPRVAVTRNGENAAVSWPSDSLGFQLESATRMAPVGDWAPVTNAATTLQGNHKVTTNAIVESQRFFRLRK